MALSLVYLSYSNNSKIVALLVFLPVGNWGPEQGAELEGCTAECQMPECKQGK